ncbi:MAG: saccharopine dehydrogenase C-terminal domain-containing protein [Thermoanaerobaculia bacterium]|nr:saccharopine dehydrogenase C-terminal domain-containing protein [Thermoanaerobaculia bacterium]
MPRITVLGTGRVGGAIARDLAADPGHAVRVADRSAAALAEVAAAAPVATVEADLADPGEVTRLARDADLVVGALPSALGFAALGAVIEAGRPYVDISFFEEDPFALDAAAREAGTTAVVDCGLAPGLGNLLLGFEAARLDEVTSFLCQVGGLPVEREPPWEYRAPFAPRDVIAEYTRPARRVAGGRQVTVEALSGRREVEVEGVGTLEAFDTDGLRTLLATLPIPEMREQTLRYPGHAEKIRLLRDSGFFAAEPVVAGEGVSVAPLELTTRLLARQWRLQPGAADLAVLRLEIEGRRDGRSERVVYELLDRYDPESGLTAMARTTGFTCTAVARRLLAGEFARPGVSAPEQVGAVPGCCEAVLADLARRGVRVRRAVEPGG